MDFEKKFITGVRLIIGAMLVIAVTSSFLMERMSNAIKKTVDENVYSLEAAQDMMSAISMAKLTGAKLYQLQFMDALERAKSNMTLPGESSLVERIEKLAPLAFAEQDQANRQIIEDLAALADLNREATQKVDEEAKFLAIAGGWAIVGLTIISLLAGSRILNQVHQQSIAPMVEICHGLSDWEQGNRLRRFQIARSSKDLRRAQQSLNAILDRLS